MERLLKHFTQEQVQDISAYIHTVVRPMRIRFYLVLVGFLAGAVVGLYTWTATHDEVVHRNCQAINDGRAIGNHRAEAIRQFLQIDLRLTAAAVRLQPVPNPKIARLRDQLTAATVHLEQSERPTPLLSCAK